MIKRTSGFQIIYTEEQKKWLESNCCPICGLPKSEWKRRKDWTCCSVDCSREFNLKNIRYWPRVRTFVIMRDKFTCKNCGFSHHSEGAFVVDHIKPISLGGEEWNTTNMQTLCIECNKIKTANDAKNIAVQRKVEKNDNITLKSFV